MNFPELIYKLIEFFFNDLFHFLEMIALILTVKGVVTKMIHSVRQFINGIKTKYRGKVNRENALRKVKGNIPSLVKNFPGKDGLKGGQKV